MIAVFVMLTLLSFAWFTNYAFEASKTWGYARSSGLARAWAFEAGVVLRWLEARENIVNDRFARGGFVTYTFFACIPCWAVFPFDSPRQLPVPVNLS